MKKTPVKKSIEKRFLVRMKEEPYLVFDDHSNGWLHPEASASRYTKKEALLKIGEILHEEGHHCILIDASEPYLSPVSIGTVVVDSTAISWIVTQEPLFNGATLHLFSPQNGEKTISVEDFIFNIQQGYYTVIWDSTVGHIPEDNSTYLSSLSQ